jgi:hypothetical protein
MVTAVAVVALVATPAIASAQPPVGQQVRELAQGANVVVSDCPFEDIGPPPTDVVCETYVVWWVRYAVTEHGRPDLERAPWHALVEHYVELVHPDGSGENLLAEAGEASTTGTFDRRLQAAHMDAVDVEMFLADPDTGQLTEMPPRPSGNTVGLGDFTWTAASPIYRWGNDGPVFEGTRHVRTPCGHLHLFAHQTLTVGHATGAIEGRSIDELFQLVQLPGLSPADGTAYIFDNAFQIKETSRCG